MRPSPRRGRVRRSLLRLFGVLLAGLALYSLAGFVGGPWLVDRWLEQYRSSGVGRTASIATTRFDPFTLVGEINSVEIRDAERGAAFTADRILDEFSAHSLTERRPVVSS
jgi:hypothetical protein